MIGMLIVTHGPLGNAFLETAELLFGAASEAAGIGFEHGDSIEELETQVRESIEKLDYGKGVLILTDVFGGSPANVSAKVMKSLEEEHQIECLAGVNLPMVLEALSQQKQGDLKRLAENCQDAGKSAIVDVREKIKF